MRAAKPGLPPLCNRGGASRSETKRSCFGKLHITLFFAVVFLVGDAAFATDNPPTFEQAKARFAASDAAILDRHGEPLQQLRVDASYRRLQWIALDDISPTLPRAVIAAEDKHFYTHHGVDWRGLAVAAWDNLFRQWRQQRLRGASTLTMQLAAQLDPTLRAGNGGRTLLQKWRQLRAAQALEARWSKQQLLEAYLNAVAFRGELRGIDAAAQGLFRKAPSGLNNSEAVLLAALLRAPSAPAATVARRGCALAAELRLETRCDDIEWLASVALDRRGDAVATANAGIARQLALRLAARAKPPFTTTLDAALQRHALATLQQQLAMLRPRNVNDGAIVVLDNASGEVLAYVANNGGNAIDGVAAQRQAGSTLKPFLYALAIEKRQLTAASVLDDSPLDIATPGGLYIPQNYDRDFKGLVSVRTALGSSLNVPAVRTLLLTGTDAFHARLRLLGFDSLSRSPDYYGFALALGSPEVSLLELSNAYRALANRGEWSAPRWFAQAAAADSADAAPPRAAIDPRAAFIVADILADNAARSVTFGLDNVLATRYWSAVKTGTSKDMRDNWCIGFSQRYTVGVWVGNFNGEPMWDVSGVTGAAPVWRDVIDYLHAQEPGAVPQAPAGIVATDIEYRPALESSRREWFIDGTESRVIETLAGAQRIARIQYPGNGVIIAIDPDIPAEKQRVLFKARGAERLRWRLDGEPQSSSWRPLPGRHVLSLVDSDERVVDSVRFEVRGTM